MRTQGVTLTVRVEGIAEALAQVEELRQRLLEIQDLLGTEVRDPADAPHECVLKDGEGDWWVFESHCDRWACVTDPAYMMSGFDAGIDDINLRYGIAAS